MRYPYDKTREALMHLKAHSDWDAHHGIRMRYSHPQTGEWVMPTIGPAVQMVPKDYTTKPYRSTDGAVFSVIEGTGTAYIAGQTYHVGPKDIFVAPPWAWRHFKADSDMVLFTFTDRPVQEKLGLFREERGA